VRVEADVAERYVTIVECRPPWRMDLGPEWTTSRRSTVYIGQIGPACESLRLSHFNCLDYASGSITPVELVGADRIAAAAQLLAPVVRRTPVLPSRALSELTGVPVHLKCENLQRTGSFKIRGAYTRLHGLPTEERARGVVAASAGNHAQGVALAAHLLGIRATVFMPTGASLPKLAATRAYGAEVHLEGAVLEASIAAATEHAERTGAVFIHPFDHVDVVAGQGTCGLEVLEQLPEVGTVLVCTGGGGLLAGVAAAVRAHRPGVRVIGVQAEQAAAWRCYVKSGNWSASRYIQRRCNCNKDWIQLHGSRRPELRSRLR